MFRLAALWIVLACLGSASEYETAARKAGKWLDAQKLGDSPNLYSGTSGVALYYLELYRATGDKMAKARLESVGDTLLAAAKSEKSSGLYTGSAGVGFVLTEIGKSTKQDRFRSGAVAITDGIRAAAQPAAGGLAWGDSTDIISGAAGIGLYLLYASRELNLPSAKETAAKAGEALIARARKTEHGLEWPMDSKFPRLMPNFSHGTAGVAYFLATLYQETKRKEFLDASLAGARHLLSIADKDNDRCQIYHHTPDGLDLYYLGWCHGPTGTARLFYQLYKATGDTEWLTWFSKMGDTLMRAGIPEKETPGFWNNVGQCCGSAGVGEFSMALYAITKDRKYLEFARRLTANLLTRGTQDGEGLKWIHAEHRAQPVNVQAQTGYMQGAAGIGIWLLRLDEAERGKPSSLRFPDSPY